MKLHFIILVPNILWRSGGSGDRGWIWFYKRYPQINFHHKQPFPHKMTGGVIEPGQKFVSKQTNEIIIEFLFLTFTSDHVWNPRKWNGTIFPSHFRQYFLTPFRNELSADLVASLHPLSHQLIIGSQKDWRNRLKLGLQILVFI